MRTTESEIHEILLELAPDAHDLKDQALIVAEAAEIYRQAEALASRIASQKGDPSKMREARLTDALLQSMGKLAEWLDDEEGTYDDIVNGIGLSAEQIVSRAASNIRVSTRGFGNNMDVLNDEDLSVFLNPSIVGHDADDYNIEDSEPRHPKSLYRKPGTPRAWPDSQTR